MPYRQNPAHHSSVIKNGYYHLKVMAYEWGMNIAYVNNSETDEMGE